MMQLRHPWSTQEERRKEQPPPPNPQPADVNVHTTPPRLPLPRFTHCRPRAGVAGSPECERGILGVDKSLADFSMDAPPPPKGLAKPLCWSPWPLDSETVE